jgi:hypothetical protein
MHYKIGLDKCCKSEPIGSPARETQAPLQICPKKTLSKAPSTSPAVLLRITAFREQKLQETHGILYRESYLARCSKTQCSKSRGTKRESNLVPSKASKGRGTPTEISLTASASSSGFLSDHSLATIASPPYSYREASYREAKGELGVLSVGEMRALQ